MCFYFFASLISQNQLRNIFFNNKIFIISLVFIIKH